MKRVNPAEFLKQMQNLPPDFVNQKNREEIERNQTEYNNFKIAYAKGECYLCSKSIKTISTESPCTHWLLRRCKFKTKEFPKIFNNFSYFQIAAYLRWVANQERFQGSINDLDELKDSNKVFQYSIKWKNIEWSFDCSKSDYAGHSGTSIDYPHYHFQMRIDGNQFINYNSFHLPFSDEDLFKIDLSSHNPDYFQHTFGPGGSGMQEAVSLPPEDILEFSTPSEDEDMGTYRMQTMIMAKNGTIKGDDVYAAIQEAKSSGKTLASVFQRKFSEVADVKTMITPNETIPDIAKRTAHK